MLLEECVDKLSAIEGEEILFLFAAADEEKGEFKGAVDGECHSAAGRAIQLGQDQAGERGCLVEGESLFESILTGSGVQHQQRFMWCTGKSFVAGFSYLGELAHQLLFILQAAGGVDEDKVAAARFGGADGVEGDGGGIATRRCGDKGKR